MYRLTGLGNTVVAPNSTKMSAATQGVVGDPTGIPGTTPVLQSRGFSRGPTSTPDSSASQAMSSRFGEQPRRAIPGIAQDKLIVGSMPSHSRGLSRPGVATPTIIGSAPSQSGGIQRGAAVAQLPPMPNPGRTPYPVYPDAEAAPKLVSIVMPAQTPAQTSASQLRPVANRGIAREPGQRAGDVQQVQPAQPAQQVQPPWEAPAIQQSRIQSNTGGLQTGSRSDSPVNQGPVVQASATQITPSPLVLIPAAGQGGKLRITSNVGVLQAGSRGAVATPDATVVMPGYADGGGVAPGGGVYPSSGVTFGGSSDGGGGSSGGSWGGSGGGGFMFGGGGGLLPPPEEVSVLDTSKLPDVEEVDVLALTTPNKSRWWIWLLIAGGAYYTFREQA